MIYVGLWPFLLLYSFPFSTVLLFSWKNQSKEIQHNLTKKQKKKVKMHVLHKSDGQKYIKQTPNTKEKQAWMLCFDFQGVINAVHYGKIRPLYSTAIPSQLLSWRRSEIYTHCNQTAGLDIRPELVKGHRLRYAETENLQMNRIFSPCGLWPRCGINFMCFMVPNINTASLRDKGVPINNPDIKLFHWNSLSFMKCPRGRKQLFQMFLRKGGEVCSHAGQTLKEFYVRYVKSKQH